MVAKLVDVTEYRVAIRRCTQVAADMSIVVTLSGIDVRRNLAGMGGRGEDDPEQTIKEAVEYLLPPNLRIAGVRRVVRRGVAER